jgi:ornithine carbamoyltransferase
MTNPTTTIAWPPHLLRPSDLTRMALDELLRLAGRMKAEPAGWTDALPGTSLACLYEVPTTRAGVSVQTAAHRLGMLPITIRPDELRRGGGESVEDAARILSGLAAAVAVRDVGDPTLGTMARTATVPVINTMSPEHHPCQALADLMTLRDRLGRLDGVVLAYVGVATSIARSLMQAGALAGLHVRLAFPPEDGDDGGEVQAADALARVHGGSVAVMDAPAAAVSDADAVYTAPWPQPADDAERRDLHERLRRYRVNSALFARARPGAIFLHALPVHRDQEVSASVVDGPRSVVWEQAANRVPTEQAVIYALVRGARGGERER